MVLVGKISLSKWRKSLKSSCWSKQVLSVVTQPHNHTTSDGSEIQVPVNTTCLVEFLQGIIHLLMDDFLEDTTYLAQSHGKKLDTLPRQNYACFLRTQNANKTTIPPKC
jgi:hypothetical protein